MMINSLAAVNIHGFSHDGTLLVVFIRFQFIARGAWWPVIQKNLIRILFESHYLISIRHCVISSWDFVKPKNLP